MLSSIHMHACNLDTIWSLQLHELLQGYTWINILCESKQTYNIETSAIQIRIFQKKLYLYSNQSIHHTNFRLFPAHKMFWHWGKQSLYKKIYIDLKRFLQFDCTSS